MGQGSSREFDLVLHELNTVHSKTEVQAWIPSLAEKIYPNYTLRD